MKGPPGEVLLLCYGNPGRLDDGLGAAFAAAVQPVALAGVTVESDYQLTVEDAAAAAGHKVVIFVDAAVGGPEPFAFRRVFPSPGLGFSSHSVEPEMVLDLAQALFGSRPEGYTLGIRGYQFDQFGEFLSAGAHRNLAAALEFMLPVLQQWNFREVAAAADEGEGMDSPLTTER